MKDQVKVEQSFANFLRAVTIKQRSKRQLEVLDEEVKNKLVIQSIPEGGQDPVLKQEQQ